MTPEEAKKLKAGDAVYVMLFVSKDGVTTEGNVRVGMTRPDKNGSAKYNMSIKPERLHAFASDMEHPYQYAFKRGDIVKWGPDGDVYIVNDTAPRLELSCDGDHFHVLLSDVELVCAAGDRMDRSAAADGSGVTRKGGRHE